MFGVGKLKQQFFRSFMEKNVGVSEGCPWKQRRGINEHALKTDMLHIYSTQYNDYLRQYFIENNWDNKSRFAYDDFVSLGKFMASKIVFGTDTIYPGAFQIFDEANTTRAYDDKFISPEKFQWQSQNRTRQASKHGEIIRNHANKNMLVHLFVTSYQCKAT